MNVAILEDEQVHIDRLKKYFAKYQQEHPQTTFSLSCYQDGFRFLEAYHYHYDLILLDIQMPSINGMEVAHRIRATDEQVRIVFITNMAEYAVEGYSVQAFDYILKPLEYPVFAAKIDRLLRVMAVQQTDVSLILKSREGTRMISANHLAYLEVSNHDVLFHMTDGTVSKQWGSLSQFEEKLKGAHFVRCNSCYLVNLKYVEGIQGESVLVCGTPLLISGPKKKSFMIALAQYMGGSR